MLRGKVSKSEISSINDIIKDVDLWHCSQIKGMDLNSWHYSLIKEVVLYSLHHTQINDVLMY